MEERKVFQVNFFKFYLDVVAETSKAIDPRDLQMLAQNVKEIRDEKSGRLFVIGLGGSAGNASHMVNDLRKLAGIEAYAPTDNVSELTARINDDGWGSALVGWLKGSRLSSRDGLFVLSVGGGSVDAGVSLEIVEAIRFAKLVDATVMGIVGRDGGFTASYGDCVLVIPTLNQDLMTPIAESFQSVIWHGLVSHPELSVASAHWESIDRGSQ